MVRPNFVVVDDWPYNEPSYGGPMELEDPYEDPERVFYFPTSPGERLISANNNIDIYHHVYLKGPVEHISKEGLLSLAKKCAVQYPIEVTINAAAIKKYKAEKGIDADAVFNWDLKREKKFKIKLNPSMCHTNSAFIKGVMAHEIMHYESLMQALKEEDENG